MAGRSSTSFQKRQKELARQEKQRDKAAKRVQRKDVKGNGGEGPEIMSAEEAELLRQGVVEQLQ
jgi:hypothetical protein